MNRRKKIIAFAFLVLMCVYITGCSNDRKIIGDDFSNKIENDFGEYLEVFDIYHSEDGEYNSYSFNLKCNNEKYLPELVDYANRYVKDMNFDNCLSIALGYYSMNQYGVCRIGFSNRWDENGIIIKYPSIVCLTIRSEMPEYDNGCYLNPKIYLDIPGIRYLRIYKAIQDKANEMGIDWYEYWPDLEEIEIID